MGFGIGAVVLLGLAVAIATRPDTFRVGRSRKIQASAEVLFGYVNDFHRWLSWSPYEKLDPNLKRTFEGASAGVGAIYRWAGNGKAGAGSMQIRESVPHERIVIDLHFTKPMAAKHVAEFTFAQGADGVEVTWTMNGTNNFMGKAFSLLVSMDKLVGKSFEEGLANLDAAAAGARLPEESPTVTA